MAKTLETYYIGFCETQEGNRSNQIARDIGEIADKVLVAKVEAEDEVQAKLLFTFDIFRPHLTHWLLGLITNEELPDYMPRTIIVYPSCKDWSKHNERARWFNNVLNLAYRKYDVASASYDVLQRLYEGGMNLESGAAKLGDMKDKEPGVMGVW